MIGQFLAAYDLRLYCRTGLPMKNAISLLNATNVMCIFVYFFK